MDPWVGGKMGGSLGMGMDNMNDEQQWSGCLLAWPGFMRTFQSLCCSYSIFLLSGESSHRLYVKEFMCPNKALFTKLGSGLNLAHGS